MALEEEGLEQKAAASAGVGQGKEGGGSGWVWWWGRGRRVSRERLVEEALELTFRLVMSGDVALDALKVCGGVYARTIMHGEPSFRSGDLSPAPVRVRDGENLPVTFVCDLPWRQVGRSPSSIPNKEVTNTERMASGERLSMSLF